MELTDKLTLTCEDNMRLMSRYENNHFDIAIIDPPYGIKEAKKNHKSRNTPVKQKDGSLLICPSSDYGNKDWDDRAPGQDFFKEVERVSMNQIIFGANYFESLMPVHKPPRRNEFDEYLEKNPIGIIIWDKINGTNDFNDCEVIWTSMNFKSFVLPYMWNGMMQGISIAQGNVMQGNKKLNEKRLNPTQKPVIIYKYLIDKFCLDGFKILDTNLGSMSIAIAAHEYGMELTGCDNDPDGFKKGIKRVQQHITQVIIRYGI